MTPKPKPKKTKAIETPWEAAQELGRLTEKTFAGLRHKTQHTEPGEIKNGLKMMTPKHKHWHIFVSKLEGPLGCNFRTEDADTPLLWDCEHNHKYATKILGMMGYTPGQIKKTIEYFRQQGGYCDCEVLFNVDKAGREEEEK